MKLKIVFLLAFSFFILQQSAVSQDVPYVPTPNEVVEEMLNMAKVTKNDLLYDLGCGDGRIVVTAATKYGARGVGIDSNPMRIEESNENAKLNEVTHLVEFKQQDLFTTDLSDATVVTLYLLTHVNMKLRPMLFEQLKPGTRIVSHAFDMGEWEPEEVKQVDGRTIYFWTIPMNVSGRWEAMTNGENPDTLILDLKQEFQKVKGTVKMGTQVYDITDSKLDGDNLQLTLNDGSNEIKFSGQVTDNQMKGSLNGSNVISSEWNAQRAANTETSLDTGL